MKDAAELASTLEWVADNRRCEGLLPNDVRAAAALLGEQNERIKELESILATKRHKATVKAEDKPPYDKEIRVRLDIADPRPFQAQFNADKQMLMLGSDDYARHVAKTTVRTVATAFEEELAPQVYQQIKEALNRTSADPDSPAPNFST